MIKISMSVYPSKVCNFETNRKIYTQYLLIRLILFNYKCIKNFYTWLNIKGSYTRNIIYVVYFWLNIYTYLLNVYSEWYGTIIRFKFFYIKFTIGNKNIQINRSEAIMLRGIHSRSVRCLGYGMVTLEPIILRKAREPSKVPPPRIWNAYLI